MAPQNKKPMSLENLPEYLKSLKENGGGTGSPIVNTGQIVTNSNSSMGWLQVTVFAMLFCMILGMGGMMTYTMMSTKNIIINVEINQSDNPSQIIQKIVSESGGEVISIEQNEDSSYQVKIATRKSRRSFLDLFRGNKDVKKAELEE